MIHKINFISKILLFVLTFLVLKQQSSGIGVLIDTQWVLTSDSFIPGSVIVGKNNYVVQAAVVQKEYRLSLLYLKYPVVNVEPVKRIRYSGKLINLPLTPTTEDGTGIFVLGTAAGLESKYYLAGISLKSNHRSLLNQKMNTWIDNTIIKFALGKFPFLGHKEVAIDSSWGLTSNKGQLELQYFGKPMITINPVPRFRSNEPMKSKELIYLIENGDGGIFVPDKNGYELAGYLTGFQFQYRNAVVWLTPEWNSTIDNLIIGCALKQDTSSTNFTFLNYSFEFIDMNEVALSSVPKLPKLYFPTPSVDPASIGNSRRHDGASLVIYTTRPDDPSHHYVLMAQRETWFKHGPDLWTFPGGLLDLGETYLQNAAREALEETGGLFGQDPHKGINGSMETITPEMLKKIPVCVIVGKTKGDVHMTFFYPLPPQKFVGGSDILKAVDANTSKFHKEMRRYIWVPLEALKKTMNKNVPKGKSWGNYIDVDMTWTTSTGKIEKITVWSPVTKTLTSEEGNKILNSLPD